MKARVLPEYERRPNPWRRFRPGRWYAAEYVDGEGGPIRLRDGRHAAEWPREQVEVRRAGDEEWEVRSVSRLGMEREGQHLEYPARVAECPAGHVRAIPTRFDAAVVNLRCAECRRSYRLVAGT